MILKFVAEGWIGISLQSLRGVIEREDLLIDLTRLGPDDCWHAFTVAVDGEAEGSGRWAVEGDEEPVLVLLFDSDFDGSVKSPVVNLARLWLLADPECL